MAARTPLRALARLVASPTLLAPIVLVALIASACGDDGGDGGGGTLLRSDVARAAPASGAAKGAADATTALGLDLLRRATAEPSAGNVMVSPLSVELALAMTRAGARGTTRTEMDRVLRADRAGDLDAGLNAIEQHLATLSREMRRADGSKATIALRTANALWGQEGTRFEDDFLDTLARFYGAGMRVVDYKTDASGARREINAWVSDQTEKKIPDLIPEGVLDELTRLVLTNAIYLKAPWEEPFEASATTPQRFTRLDGSTVDAPTMKQTIETSYARLDGFEVVALPYAGDTLRMVVVVPATGRFRSVESTLDGAAVAAAFDALKPTTVNLSFPKFTFRTQLMLGTTLRELGMATAFSNAADFSGMTTEERLAISEVIHESFVAVDEKGTEAAAATAVVMRATAAPAEPVTLKVDRPFLFLIVDTQNRTPLFLGRVVDPTATSG